MFYWTGKKLIIRLNAEKRKIKEQKNETKYFSQK